MYQPLADLLRPVTLDEVYGQEHILAEGAILRRIVDSGNIPNMIFYGPAEPVKRQLPISSRSKRTEPFINSMPPRHPQLISRKLSRSWIP